MDSPVSSQSPESRKRPATMGLLTLVLVTSALFLTLRNLPSLADTGLQMVFFNGIAAFAFLIPVALVSAELATGWPKNGVYHWVSASYGPRFGFLASWLQWGQSMFGMTSILAYVGASFAYVINPNLATNKYFVFATVLIVYWIATLANMKGTRWSGIISSVCVSAGVLFPILALIVLGIIYWMTDGHVYLESSEGVSSWIPNPENKVAVLMFLNVVFGYVGVEVSASHAREVKNVHRTYPLAVFLAAVIGFALTLAGGFVVAIVLPLKDINVVSGAVQAFGALGEHFGMDWLLPAAAILVAVGAAGQVSTWVFGPVKGLLATARMGDLPPLFQKTNQAGAPRNLLIFQACTLSVISLAILISPDVNTAFMVLTTVAVLLYSIMYCIMFSAAIRLRYKEPNVKRPYRVPGGNLGMWIVSGIGLITLLACFFIAFIPPPGLSFMSPTAFIAMMVGVTVVSIAIPLVLFKFRRKSWVATGEVAMETERPPGAPLPTSCDEKCVCHGDPAFSSRRVPADA